MVESWLLDWVSLVLVIKSFINTMALLLSHRCVTFCRDSNASLVNLYLSYCRVVKNRMALEKIKSVRRKLKDGKVSKHQPLLFTPIQQSDPVLFTQKYATKCGDIDGRKPIQITHAESKVRANIGSLPYGSTSKLNKENRFICPDVWCHKSRVSMTFAGFAARGKKCPLKTEIPVVRKSRYFDGKSAYPGYLNPNQHPSNLCMPCCFKAPQTRVTACLTKLGNPKRSVKEKKVGKEAKRTVKSTRKTAPHTWSDSIVLCMIDDHMLVEMRIVAGKISVKNR